MRGSLRLTSVRVSDISVSWMASASTCARFWRRRSVGSRHSPARVPVCSSPVAHPPGAAERVRASRRLSGQWKRSSLSHRCARGKAASPLLPAESLWSDVQKPAGRQHVPARSRASCVGTWIVDQHDWSNGQAVRIFHPAQTEADGSSCPLLPASLGRHADNADFVDH